MNDIFQYPFLLRGLVASILFGALGGFLSPFIISRRMAMYADSLSHASLTGIIIALMLGISPTETFFQNSSLFSFFGIEKITLVLIVSSLIFSVVISFIIEHSKLPKDSAIIFFFYGTLALGIFLLGMSQSISPSVLHSFLFGSVLGVSGSDLILLSVTAIVVVFFFFLNMNRFLLSTWNRDIARVRGIRVRLFDYLFLVVISFTIAIGIRLVGNLLLGALLVIPGIAAKNLSVSFRGFLILSTIIGISSGFLGFLLASPDYFNTFPGPTIIMMSIATYFLTLGIKSFSRKKI